MKETPDGSETPTLEESNRTRLIDLQANFGAGVNGINEALLIRALEALCGPVVWGQVRTAHELWLSEQLDALEAAAEQHMLELEEVRRRAMITGGRRA